MRYTEARNKVTSSILKDRKTFKKKIAKEMKENMKIFWKYVNRQKKNKPKIPDLIKAAIPCTLFIFDEFIYFHS